MCVDVHDEKEHVLRPIFARGVHAARSTWVPTLPDDVGEGGHVIRTGEPMLIEDELNDNACRALLDNRAGSPVRSSLPRCAAASGSRAC